MRRRRLLKTGLGASSSIGLTWLAGCTTNQGDGSDGDSDGAGTTAGDGTDEGDSGGEMTTLELWHDKGKNPNWNPVFEATLPTLNENIDGPFQIEQNPFQSTDAFQGSIRPVLGTQDGPAIFSWWTGARLQNIVESDFALDISDVWQKHIDNGEYAESVVEPFSVDGNAYAVPSITAYWPVWYNTETFDELGVQPPETWDEFLSLSQTIIDESGGDTAPVAIPLGPAWTGFVWFEELVLRQSVEFYNQLCAGEEKYTDDIVLNALSQISDLSEQGVFGGVDKMFSLQLDDLPRVLENGDYAMTLMGSWVSSLWSGDLSFDSYDWFALPPLNSDVGNQLVIEPGPFVPHAGHQEKDGIRAGIDAMLSTEFRQAWNEEQGFIPVNKNVDTSYLPDAKVSLAEAIGSGEFSFPLRYWENTSPDVAVPASKTLKKAYRPNASVEDVASEIDNIRQQVYG